MSKDRGSYLVRDKVSRPNLKYETVWGNIRLEISSMCQLNFPLCTTKKEVGKRKNNRLKILKI